MKKRNLIVVIILLFICISSLITYLYISKTRISIPNNYNLKIALDYKTEPTTIYTYYFYDDTIIKTNSSSGVLPRGSSEHTNITKYYFSYTLDLSELKDLLNTIPKDEYNLGAITVTEKNGTTYELSNSVVTLQDNQSFSTLDNILNKIRKITDTSTYIRSSSSL